jgi:hypothetical protein
MKGPFIKNLEPLPEYIPDIYSEDCMGKQCALHDPETEACSIATSSTVLETIAIQLTSIANSLKTFTDGTL